MKTPNRVPTVLLAAALATPLPALAETHAASALEHATEAANARDSKSVAEHARKALEHTEQAKAAVEPGSEAARHLEQGESHLRHAVKNADRYNTNSAIDAAQDSAKHLNAVSP
jgi:soluble cytochrome b562